MIRFLNDCRVPQEDGSRKLYKAGTEVPESELPARWLANALQRAAVERIETNPTEH